MKFSMALPAFLAALSTVSAQDAAPSGVYVKSVVGNGSGCPPGSFQTQISDDRKVVTLIFSSFSATLGRGTSIGDRRKNCQVNLKLNYPSGFQWSVVGVTTRGYASLTQGVQARVESSYYFSGQPGTARSIATLNGPYSTNYEKTDNMDLKTAVWSPCDSQGMANINTVITLNEDGSNGNPVGLLQVDSIDTSFKQKLVYQFSLDWRRAACGATDVDSSNNMVISDSVIQMTQ